MNPQTPTLTGSTQASPTIAALRAQVRESIIALTAARALYFDERVLMGRASGEWRAQQRAFAARHAHERATSIELERAIAAAEDAEPDNVEVMAARRDFDRANALTADLVEQRAAATSRARTAWAHARETDDFTVVQAELEQMLTHAREHAEHLGYGDEPYDALVTEYEPHVTAASLDRVFAELVAGLRPLIDRVDGRGAGDVEVLERSMSLEAKHAFERFALGALGFDDTRGRVDGASRAFCIRLGPDDVRIVTRFHSTPGLQALTSSMHEAGHAIYRQAFGRLGVPVTLADIASLGIDESQSRLFENTIGRSRELWQHLMPELQRAAPGTFDDVDAERMHRALTAVKRSLIRVDADELTYNLHIAVRFELERAMVNGELRIADLPEAWREATDRVIGIATDSDRDGCLQDVHWSIGQWGYFPGYTLGNVYAAQLMRAARRALPNIDADIAAGDVSGLVGWLDRTIYRYGSSVDGVELVRRVDGDIDASALIAALTARYDS